MSHQGDTPEKELPLKVSISFRDKDQRKFADERAKAHHGGNLSGYIQSLVDDDKSDQNAPFSDLRKFALIVERIAAKCDVKLERPEKGVDFIAKDLKVGIEVKTKFPRGESIMQQMIVYSAAQEKLKRVLLVIPDEADAVTETLFRNTATNMVVVPVSVLRIGALPTELKKLKAGD